MKIHLLLIYSIYAFCAVYLIFKLVQNALLWLLKFTKFVNKVTKFYIL